ncbi:MAG: DNA polymerase-3 subunit alpha [Myxococcota bacterium]|jgi:DNA polymerase-3 subunit alpha
MEPFVHLHVHTEYSLLDGANKIDSLTAAAVEDGHDSIAITDHGNLYGAMEFYKSCRAKEIKPILGCEIYIAEKSMYDKHNRTTNPYSHLTLLARNAKGWENLMKLSSDSHTKGMSVRPRIDMEHLAQHAEGLTVLSGCMSGPVNKLLRREQEDEARNMAGTLADMFGREHFFLEIMRNGIKEQDDLTTAMVRMKDQVGLPLVATNDIHYSRHEDCSIQDALLCLGIGGKYNDPNRWRFDTDSLFFRTRQDMNRVFHDLPEALRNTIEVSNQIDVELEIGRLRMPVFTPEDGRSPEKMFRELCEDGIRRLYPEVTDVVRKRLEYEIKVITEMGFVSYFLIVWDLIRFARDSGIPVGPGRGSAAGSIVAYALEITKIDPLKYDLIFERFLNPGRMSMPDIDIDFCKDRREEMIIYTREKYGDENVCQIITFGRLKAKNALRDMGRILEIPLQQVDKAAKLIPDDAKTLQKAIDTVTELQEFRDSCDEYAQWFEFATKVEGFARNTGVHAAGVIIADEPLRNIAPISRVSGNITTQWDMKYSEEYGLLKMDFLGLRTLSILHEAVAQVDLNRGIKIDLDTISLEDKATFELFCNADTEGVFQLESSGMRTLLNNLQPSVYEDIIAVLALYRPGPLGSGLHEVFTRRKHGTEAVSFDHPILEPILKETYGVLIYQEQIMRVAQQMGGFSLADADNLRKAMGKKDPELMDRFKNKFIEGATAQDVDLNISTKIWEMMVKFAEYGFNKSHSAAYAMVTFQAAYMKAHYPAEFYTASYTYEASDKDKLRVLIEDARRHQINLLPPCVNQSTRRFQVVDNETIRFGLEAIKGVGGGAADALVEIRDAQEGGVFTSMQDVFVEGTAVHVNKGTFESMAMAGCFDVFGNSRMKMLNSLENDLKIASSAAKDRQKGQGSLFDMFGGGGGDDAGQQTAQQAPADDNKQADELSDAEKKQQLTFEKEVLGIYLSSHPLDPYRHVATGLTPFDSRSVKEAGDNALIDLFGLTSQLNIRSTAKDPSKKFGKFEIEDLYGSTPAVVFNRTIEECGDLLAEDTIALFKGKIQISNDIPEMIINEIVPAGAPESLALQGILEISFAANQQPSKEIMSAMKLKLEEHSGDSKVRFVVFEKDGEEISGRHVIRAGSQWNVQLSSELIEKLNIIIGANSTRVIMERGSVEREAQPSWKTARQ